MTKSSVYEMMNILYRFTVHMLQQLDCTTLWIEICYYKKDSLSNKTTKKQLQMIHLLWF